jgi:hypothetical protein
MSVLTTIGTHQDSDVKVENQFATQLEHVISLKLIRRRKRMKTVKMLVTVVAGAVLATGAFAQSAKEFRGASPYVTIENEPAPKLIVDPPLAEGLQLGVFWAQYRVERPCSGRVPCTYLRVSAICTYKLTTYGGGRMRATATQST